MDKDAILKLFSQDEESTPFHGDRIIDGFILLKGYFPDKVLLCAVGHDEIYSIDIDELVEAKVTETDLKTLRNLGFFVDQDCLAHFV